MPESNSSLWLFVIPLLSGVAAFVLILALTPLAGTMRVLDCPDERKRHREPTPMVGGIAIYLVLGVVLLVVSPPPELAWMMASATILVIVGFLDDAFNLGWGTRLAAQLGSTCLMIFGSGIFVESLGFNTYGLDQLGWFGIGLTIFAVLCLTNGFNMLDGVDGLASGHVLVVIGSLVVCQLLTRGTLVQPLWLSVLATVVFAFWLVNMSLTPLKKVFLGDAGSLLLGFVVCWLLIYYSQQPIAALVPVAVLWCAALPIMDTALVIFRRIARGKSPFEADRIHLHHLLIDLGVPPRRALGLMLMSAIVINAFGLLTVYLVSPFWGLILFMATFALFASAVTHPSVEDFLIRRFGHVGS
jgi:undecaprenyl-phosphate alpha-N-acetylglucosaminyl 1-phosphatetransferase